MANKLVSFNDATFALTPAVQAYQDQRVAAAISAAGAGPGSTVPFYLAANNSSAAHKALAGVVCDGSGDQVEIQAALDTVSSNGGEVVLLPGSYNISATIKMRITQTTLRFMTGAQVRWSAVTGRTPLIQVLISNVFVEHPYVSGSGSKGNGIGIQIGGQASTEPIVGADQPGGVHITHPRFVNLDTGLEFGIQSDGSQSTGDCVMWGGRISECKIGVKSVGFVNYVHSPFISSCNIGIQVSSERTSGKIVVNGATINQWASAAIEVLNGRGTIIRDVWAEHTATQTGVPTECVRIAPTSGAVVRNLTFEGVSHFHCIDAADGTQELYGIRLSGRVQGLYASRVEFTDELVGVALIRCDATFEGNDNVIERLTLGDTVPSTYNYSKVLSNVSTLGGSLVIREIPDIAGSRGGATLGGTTPTPVKGTYRIDVAGPPNAATYWAKAATGHIAAMAPDTATTSGFKAVMESLVADNVHFEFGPNRYHCLDAPLGTETWAGDQDHVGFGSGTAPLTGVTFSGTGMRGTIISNRTNWPTGADTEPFSFTNAQYITIQDLTVESCGYYKGSTDAIDFDQGSYNVVQRVRITRSRSRGIVADGGDNGKNAQHNVFRDNVIQGRPEKPGLSISSGGTLTASAAFRYVVSWVDMDLTAAGTAGETKPSDEAIITTDASNRSVKVNLPLGPYSCTARKVYRSPVGSSSWVLVNTTSDNTTEVWTDTGVTGSAVTMPVSHASTIPQSGIEVLGSDGNLITGNTIDGTGDLVIGANPYGVNVVRKGSGSTTKNSNRNRVIGNIVKQTGGNGIRMFGASDTVVSSNTVVNPGSVATRSAHIRIDSIASATTNNNLVSNNRCIEDQDANSWSTGKTSNNVIVIGSTNAPTGNVVQDNFLDAGASSPLISDGGTLSVIKNNRGSSLGPASITPGASPYTYTAGSTPEVVYITGGTVSSVTKGGVTLFSTTGVPVYLEPNEAIVVTYSSTPTMVRDRK